ncbi:Peroxisomal NADH pyrophosphatase nudt12 [Aphanomyces cochlioides]|nr:Peroxisomal NADH pyrophosphatase nudt12 [Aphanomyces cochlioides]
MKTATPQRRNFQSVKINKADQAKQQEDAAFASANYSSALEFYGADLFVKDPHNKIALDWARLANHEGVVQQLELAIHQHNCTRRINQAKDETQRRNADLLERNAQLCASMADALSRGNDEIRQLIRVNDDLTADLFTQARGESDSPFFLDYETKLGWTALTKAAAHGDFPIVELLVRHGADVNLETRLRHTPLTWAAYSGHKEIVQFLLQCGADVLKKTREGKTALIHACRNNQTVIVSILISKYHHVCIGPTTKKDYVDEKTPEWHNVFLDALLSADIENKCALAHAEEQGHDAVIALLQQAIDRAKEHHDHVEHLKTKTMTVACSLGCGFEHAKDLMKYHEETQCPHRSIECDECKMTLRSMELDLHKVNPREKSHVVTVN